jgi:hypothetical protein
MGLQLPYSIGPFWSSELKESFEDPLEEFADWALECFLPMFQKIPPLSSKRKYTPQEGLPVSRNVSLLIVCRRGQIIACPPRQDWHRAIDRRSSRVPTVRLPTGLMKFRLQ